MLIVVDGESMLIVVENQADGQSSYFYFHLVMVLDSHWGPSNQLLQLAQSQGDSTRFGAALCSTHGAARCVAAQSLAHDDHRTAPVLKESLRAQSEFDG